MWNGTAPNLNASPATMNTTPNTITVALAGTRPDIAAAMRSRSSVPVPP